MLRTRVRGEVILPSSSGATATTPIVCRSPRARPRFSASPRDVSGKLFDCG